MIKISSKEILEIIENSSYIGEDFNIEGVSSDTRKITPECLFVPLVGNRVNGHDYVREAIENGARASLWQKNQLNPPKDIPLIMVDDVLLALQELARDYRNKLKATFIGITGSNGKTSTKDILASILATTYKTQKTDGNFNSEIGVPLTLLKLDLDTEMVVIEMGMWAKKEISFLSQLVKPDIAVITSVGSAHLVDLGSIENIAEAKMEIVDGLSSDGVLVYNGDNQLLESKAKKAEISKISFGQNITNDYYLETFKQTEKGIWFKLNDTNNEYFLPIIGKHQAINSIAAIIVARQLKVAEKLVALGLATASLSSWRNELVTIGKMTIINDSYKSNPESVEAALTCLYQFEYPTKKLVVIGDMLDLGVDSPNLHYQVGIKLDHTIVDSVFGFGGLTIETIKGAKLKFGDKAIHFNDEDKLIEAILAFAKQPCIILFKASRGLQFEKLVEKITERIEVDETTVIN